MYNKTNIFYRTTARNKNNNLRPSWFNYENCFANLISTLDNDCTLTVMFDGNEEEYNNYFIEKHKNKFNFNIVFLNSNSDIQSNHDTFNYIKTLDLNPDDLIYVLENDYLHLKNWNPIVRDLYSFSDGMHYTGLFDHNDKYLCQNDVEGEWGMYKNLFSKVYATNTRHWRTVPSTCGSFIMTKKLFDQDFEILSSKEADNTRFGILSKTKNRIVLTPIPGLATHVQNPWMSPCVNWEKINNIIK